MSAQSVIELIQRYESLPMTEERKKINDRFLSDEIGHFEFYQEAKEYLRKHNSGNHHERKV